MLRLAQNLLLALRELVEIGRELGLRGFGTVSGVTKFTLDLDVVGGYIF